MQRNILFILALLVPLPGNAQGPNLFKYQAVVRDASGYVLAGDKVLIQIEFLQGSTSGTVVYSEIQQPVSNGLGVINIQIGKGTVLSGSFSSVDWSKGPYFMRVSINGSIMGTSQLLSVPYAKYADVAGNGFNGNYKDLSNKPRLYSGTWDSISGIPAFSTVATSGSYTDLMNKPDLFSGNYNNLISIPSQFDLNWGLINGKPVFSTVATSGSYTDLLNLPTLFSGNYNDLTNLPTLFNGTWASLTGKPTFATVATSGSYYDLVDTPTLFNGKWSSLTGTPATLAGYGITDAMSTSDPANGITNSEISNWNTMYGWGNPSLTYYTKLNLQTNGGSSVSWDNITNMPATLAGYGITNGMSTSDPANGITNADITNWNTMYGWGNPALTYYSKTNLQTNGQSSVNWGNITNTPATLVGYDITNFSISSPSNNQLLLYNGSQWVNWTPTYADQTMSLSGKTLTLTGGNSVTFSGWDNIVANDLLLTTSQTVTGNKTFTGTFLTSGTFNVNDGINSQGNTIVNIKQPKNPQDMATKAYVDSFQNIYNNLLSEYYTILASLNNGSTVTDIDGNVYPIVTIGSQVWMAANLQTTHYNTGDSIGTTYPDTLDISGYDDPEFQWPVDGNTNNLALYGRLYTWYAATDSRNVCPAGWHLPDSTEYITLITYEGGVYSGTSSNYYIGAGNNLKAVGTQTWMTIGTPNAGNNTSGFTWVGNGNRYPGYNESAGGTFTYFQQYGSIWSASLNQNSIPCHFNARTQYNAIYPDDASYHPASMGCAVRCVKN